MMQRCVALKSSLRIVSFNITLKLRTNGCNNSQHCWGLQCIVGRIKPIRLGRPCVMSVRGPNNVGRAVQTNPTLLHYASAIMEQLVKKCWELPAQKFDQFQTLRNNSQQHTTTCNRINLVPRVFVPYCACCFKTAGKGERRRWVRGWQQGVQTDTTCT